MNRTVALLAAGLLAPPAAAQTWADLFVDQLTAHFGRWDGDRNGTLSAAELDAAVADRRLTGDQAAAVAAVKLWAREHQGQPLTLSALRQRAADRGTPRQPGLGLLFAYGRERVAAADQPLFASGRPRLAAVQQGGAGNCYCLAPLGGLVDRDAVAVARMFTPWPGGGYEVAFAAGRVRVPPLAAAEVVLTGQAEADGRWVGIYERAVAEALDRQAAKRAGLALDATAFGGRPGPVVELLTGHKAADLTFAAHARPREEAATPAEVRAVVSKAGRKLMVACTPDHTPTPGVQPHHAYAVLGFDPAAERVRLWDPHGGEFAPAGRPGPANGYPTAAGVLSIPFGEFVTVFAHLTAETDAPAGKR